MINAPYYTRNTTIFRDRKINTVCTSITKTATRYISRLVSHTNKFTHSRLRRIDYHTANFCDGLFFITLNVDFTMGKSEMSFSKHAPVKLAYKKKKLRNINLSNLL